MKKLSTFTLSVFLHIAYQFPRGYVTMCLRFSQKSDTERQNVHPASFAGREESAVGLCCLIMFRNMSYV
jgi:hypothetical protein